MDMGNTDYKLTKDEQISIVFMYGIPGAILISL